MKLESAVRMLIEVLEGPCPAGQGQTWASIVERIEHEVRWNNDCSHWARAQLPRLRAAVDLVKSTLDVSR